MRDQIFTELKAAIERHTQAEKQIFYPTLTSHKYLDGLTEEAEEDHELITEFADKLALEPKFTRGRTEKLKILRENVEMHFEDEEANIFEAMTAVFDQQTLDTLATRWHEVRSSQQA